MLRNNDAFVLLFAAFRARVSASNRAVFSVPFAPISYSYYHSFSYSSLVSFHRFRALESTRRAGS